MPPKVKPVKDTSTANLGFEQKLWLTADSRGEAEAKRSEGGPARFLQIPGHTAEGNRSNAMDAAEPSAARQTVRSTARRVSEANQYKHVVLGLIFLKYISDTFEEHRAKCLAD